MCIYIYIYIYYYYYYYYHIPQPGRAKARPAVADTRQDGLTSLLYTLGD